MNKFGKKTTLVIGNMVNNLFFFVKKLKGVPYAIVEIWGLAHKKHAHIAKIYTYCIYIQCLNIKWEATH